MAKPVKEIGAFTDTVGKIRPGFPHSLVQGWDQEAGLNQAIARAATRAAQGRKKTPIGPGKMSPK